MDDDDDELQFNDASTHGVVLRLEGYEYGKEKH